MGTKTLLRDTLLVIPILLFTVVRFGLDVDFAHGGDHMQTFLFNLVLPLAVIAAGRLLYAAVLMREVLRSGRIDDNKKVWCCVGTLFAAVLLYPLVCLYRVVIVLREA